LGIVEPLTNILVVRDFPDRSEAENSAVAAHELAHLCGALHTAEARSLMHPSAPAGTFDVATAEVLALMRNYDFRRGPASLDQSTARRLVALLSRGRNEVAVAAGLAAVFRKQRLPQTAAAVLNDSVVRHPNDVLLRHELGLALRQMDRLEEAEANFAEAVRLNPADVESLVEAGIAAGKRGALKTATARLQQAVQLRPGDARLRYNYGIALSRQLGGVGAAIAEFEAALRINPQYHEARKAAMVASNKRARLRLDEAAWRKRLSDDPRDATAYCNLGVSLSEQGRFGEAMEQYRRALNLNPRLHSARANLALLLHVTGRSREALIEAELVRREGGALHPDFARALEESRLSSPTHSAAQQKQ
jgi:tetratricopeptide (TPR) repeat protein